MRCARRSEGSIPRTPLLAALLRLAADHTDAERLGTTPEAVRETRAAGVLSRRTFLAGAAAGAVAVAVPRWAFAKKGQPRIAIVGGGMAGMACALALRDRGLASTVYEASGRLGGRMFSNATYFDEGQVSEWCGELIDTGHTTIRRLARRFRLPLIDVHAGEPQGSKDIYRFFGNYYTAAQADADFAPVYRAVRDDLHSAGYPTTYRRSKRGGRALDAISVHDWIETRVPGGHGSPFGALLDIAYATEYGADTTDQSALNLVYLLAYQPRKRKFAAFGESDETFRIAGGNQRLPLAIAKRLGVDETVRLGRSLASIRRLSSGGAYELTFDTSSGSDVVQADLVVLALPFSVLRDLDFAQAGFDERKALAIRELGSGRNGKLQMQFTSRIWAGTGAWPGIANGASYADAGYQQTWDASRSQAGTSGLINNYTGGAVSLAQGTALPFATVSDTGVATDVATSLARIEQVFPGVTAAWNGKATHSLPHLSPYFKGSYAYWRVGQYRQFGGYEGVRQGGVLFAGDHCSQDFQGFMEGAASEGERAGVRAALLAR